MSWKGHFSGFCLSEMVSKNSKKGYSNIYSYSSTPAPHSVLRLDATTRKLFITKLFKFKTISIKWVFFIKVLASILQLLEFLLNFLSVLCVCKNSKSWTIEVWRWFFFKVAASISTLCLNLELSIWYNESAFIKKKCC